jgi:hypothetical protein
MWVVEGYNVIIETKGGGGQNIVHILLRKLKEVWYR